LENVNLSKASTFKGLIFNTTGGLFPHLTSVCIRTMMKLNLHTNIYYWRVILIHLPE